MENKMIEKINIAELLKDCPRGMELDCASYNNVSFDKISDDKKATYPIFCYITDEKGNRSGISFTENGCESKRYGAKCVIFPKGKTTWDGFHRPFKDGDILTSQLGSIFILKKPNENNSYYGCYIAFDFVSKFVKNCTQLCSKKDCRFATEEEKQKLFDAIKEHGYHWNDETKTLEELLKFKVGDVIRCIKNINNKLKIIEITDNYYICENNFKIYFKFQEYWELVPNKFDVIAFKPFDKVLVRDNDDCTWRADFYSHYENNIQFCYVCAGDAYKQCIPYNEETAHLIGTTNDCPDKYKIWKDE